MRNMSFMLTMTQVRRSFDAVRRARRNLLADIFITLEKDVTRRDGWEFLQVGDRLAACEKCQGLGKGGKIVKLGEIIVTDVRREPLRRMLDEAEYGRAECAREGFPDMTPEQFVAFFCKGHKGISPDSIITRIEFAYA